jgi:hypothetical protein
MRGASNLVVVVRAERDRPVHISEVISRALVRYDVPESSVVCRPKRRSPRASKSPRSREE